MTQTTAIIDYGSGNLRSVEKSFARMAAELDAGSVLVTSDPDSVSRADRIVLPGVGAFADCRAGLLAVDGMYDCIAEKVSAATPFFGICVGMQLLASIGLEFGETPGFDWISGEVTALRPAERSLKIPHMGWNTLDITRKHPVLAGIEKGDHAYFVHSYHLKPHHAADRVATTEYGETVTAAVARDMIFGTQFHPEKSQKTGLRIIGNFLTWAV